MSNQPPETQRRRWQFLIGCGAISILLLAGFLILNVIGLTI